VIINHAHGITLVLAQRIKNSVYVTHRTPEGIIVRFSPMTNYTPLPHSFPKASENKQSPLLKENRWHVTET